MLAIGHKMKCHVRKMSNPELDEFISNNLPDCDEKSALLKEPRHVKIRALSGSAMKSFADRYNESQKKKEVDTDV
jgi:hypothetical protein